MSDVNRKIKPWFSGLKSGELCLFVSAFKGLSEKTREDHMTNKIFNYDY